MAKILILESIQNEYLASKVLSTVNDILEENKFTIDTISVNEPFSLLCSASTSLELHDYDGVIILGTVFKDTPLENKLIYQEILRCFCDLSVHYALPVGFGMVLATDKGAAFSSIEKKARTAAHSCVDLIKLKNQFGLIENESFARYNN
ncbi:MAG: Riboflavin synthase beta-chain [Candidatus Midichloria mitochondrii]|uniref:Riboflavin synthase beta-chain n=1 Tax=Midichloria mitochondrii (strain IricVA) TaxID=696127 RepID=F7XWU9_MIDMI|nr:6,7-dimethyl-8-ribityllumazine synthase [Candidatus Midichloria mitochondrii]AEI89148.1 riboflavin synthase beta-chain [Candidatus Midichloria mitochondrii IricVA]MDJ1256711.1 6,7-dimethyl-8-ribityllumazine synthase [Candidatus Midichloria mitochondrii]MDJ1288423.1 6,7-dimethyl-8-ribityllumazine synthase [Candidatus Midichloria mitochondrii]MDJ1299285.1 6,7-dimethyl-8-ribityllumazine synthase [Candidatus Midichloria mitochondrii]MDJ1312631.1 6,7-dimethyl-8-ribityllumazine synthase [Candidat